MTMTALVLGAACLIPLMAQEPLTTVGPERVMPGPDDYAHLWWADGVRERSIDGRWLRCVQTGHYGMALDADTVQVAHLGPLALGQSYHGAALQDNAAVLGLPAAGLELSITVGARTYRCVRGGEWRDHSGPRIIESGRFMQRADITDLVFEDDAGERLLVDARFETVAWPDRLTLVLIASPGRPDLVAGPSFGRVGGGFGFDGASHTEVPHSPELEPETLTLETWVYIPEGPSGTRHYPWVICKSGNEWADGNYGFTLGNGVPSATVNIGGGRENQHTVTARSGPLSREAWHQLAMTYDGSDLRLYVDGVERGSQAVDKPRTRGTGGLAIGRRQDGDSDGYHFRGYMDEVRLYGRALSADELHAHYQAPEQVRPDEALVREWTFDAGGPALAARPAANWPGASLRIALNTPGANLSAEAHQLADEDWTQARPGIAALSLVPGDGHMVLAPPPPAVSVSAATVADGAPRPVTYDALRDWFRVDLDGVEPQGTGNDTIERVRLTIENAEPAERAVHLLLDKNAAGIRMPFGAPPTGMSPMLRDASGNPSGIPVQLSKNWHSQPDKPLAYQGAWMHGFSMLRVPARSRVELEFTLVYGHWGGVAAASHAQLCLIGWGSNQLWDEAAVGNWGESICFEPDQAQAQAAVLDVRPLMVHQMNCDLPREWGWTNNVGGADFLRYFAASGRRVPPRRMRTTYLRQGPCLTEVTYAGEGADGAFEHSETVSLYRTDDITRGIYRVRMDVHHPLEFSRFVVFQVGADTYSYTGERKMALGNEDGLVTEWDTRFGGSDYHTPPMECTGRVPWISLHEAISRDPSGSGAWANRGIVIRQWEARLGGQPAAPFMAEYGTDARGTNTSVADILPPPGVTRLEPGDYVEATFEHVIVPQRARDYYGPNTSLKAALEAHADTWRMIAREALGNDVTASVITGALERALPLRIRAAGDRAAFSLTGGLGYVPITITGLSSCQGPVLQTREAGGEWQVVDQTNHGRDFWQTDYDPAAREWQITYTVPLDTPGDARVTREFRFHTAAAR